MAWTTSYYHYDAVGTTRQLTDSTETVTDTYLNDAFGNQLAESGATENPFRYVGQMGYYRDSDSTTYYVRARTYWPTVIRWLSIDPILFESGDDNLFRYMINSPGSGVDPSGLQWILPSYVRPAPPDTHNVHLLTVQEYAWTRCKSACIKIYNIGNPLAPSSYVGGAADDAHTFGDAMAQLVNKDTNSAENISIRHCIASAYLARAVGCECAQCLGLAREQHQYYEHLFYGPLKGNTLEQAQRGEYRNRIGRLIAGCTGADGDVQPTGLQFVVTGGRNCPPCLMSLSVPVKITNDQIIERCKAAWIDGRLDAFRPGLRLPQLDRNIPTKEVPDKKPSRPWKPMQSIIR